MECRVKTEGSDHQTLQYITYITICVVTSNLIINIIKITKKV